MFVTIFIMNINKLIMGITRKDLESKFYIIGNNNSIALYDAAACKSGNGRGYSGNCSIKNGKIHFNGNVHDNVDSFVEDLKAFANSPCIIWPMWTYDPYLNEDFRKSSRIGWHLIEKLGFKYSDTYSDYLANDRLEDKYVLDTGLNTIIVYISVIGGKISVRSNLNGMFVEGTYDSITSSVEAVETIVKSILLNNVGSMCEVLSKLQTNCNIDLTLIDTKNLFDITKIDFKQYMVTVLENELKKLKDE